MGIPTVSPDQYEHNRSFLKQMYRLRATVFGGDLEWDVYITAGEERYQHDDYKPTYLLAITGCGLVAGRARLLPTTGPTMLEQTFPQLLETGPLAAHSGMDESSRFCVDTSLVSRRDTSHVATLTLFSGTIEWSMASGYGEIVTATDLRFERILKRAGWPMRRLGEPAAIGNTIAVAGSLPAGRASFEQVCPSGYHSIPLIDGASIRSAA
ncbi:autoinducer synthesis protein (plasmid) [Sinorhizobium meliloti]|uniref:acyl-homoserine-lactone synthase n=1 Tax=Rhizobium meliloti TaxID=382 RepID=UPI000B49ECF4|nr:acyl-homoserine-lactone synthase TraI [Sinorhizobium meliloti]ASP89578.1 autoinducer synthesis protein [Sinorhizobium meliloti]MQW28565.1 autoinducer synthesis protein [Sinorhizobium meliloti]